MLISRNGKVVDPARFTATNSLTDVTDAVWRPCTELPPAETPHSCLPPYSTPHSTPSLSCILKRSLHTLLVSTQLTLLRIEKAVGFVLFESAPFLKNMLLLTFPINIFFISFHKRKYLLQ